MPRHALGFEGADEEGADFLESRGIAELPVAMTGAFEGSKGRVHSGFLQRGMEVRALPVRHEKIAVAMHDEKWRIIGGNAGDGAGGAGLVPLFLDGTADEPGFRRIGRVVGNAGIRTGLGGHREEVGRAEPVAHSLDAGRLGGIFTLVPLLHIARGTEHGDEMTASGTAPNADSRGIDMEFLRICAQPAEGGLAVFDLCREWRVLAETVGDAGNGESILQEGQRGCAILAAIAPSAAVNPDDERERLFHFFGKVHIEHPARAAAGDVFDVAPCSESRGQRDILRRAGTARLLSDDSGPHDDYQEKGVDFHAPQETARGCGRCGGIAIGIAAWRAAPHKAAMFALGGDALPNDTASLVAALNQGAAALRMNGDVARAAGDFPSLASLTMNLTGARLDDLKMPQPRAGTDAGGCFARIVELKAEPAFFAGIGVRVAARAEDCVLAFCAADDGSRMVRVAGCAGGHIEAGVKIADAEAALLKLAQDAAAEHGAEVESVKLAVASDSPRGVAITATAVAKAMFFTATLTIRGRIDINEQFNLRAAALRCEGDGMIANLAAARLRPQLAKWEGRAIPLAALLPAGLRVGDVSAATGEALTVRAIFTTAKP